MASIRLAYLGGGSTRAAGTMAAFVHNHGASFAGSEVVLIDLVPERLAIVERLAARMARGPRARHPLPVDDRPARGADRRRRGPVELPARRLRGPRARRAHPAQARGHRPGDPGTGRVLHGAPLDPRAAGGPGGPGPGRAAGAHLQLHQPGEHRGPGRHACTRPSRSPRSARAPTTSPRSSRTRRASTGRSISARDDRAQPHHLVRVSSDYDGRRRDARHPGTPGRACATSRTSIRTTGASWSWP